MNVYELIWWESEKNPSVLVGFTVPDVNWKRSTVSGTARAAPGCGTCVCSLHSPGLKVKYVGEPFAHVCFCCTHEFVA